jgi:hypothetical protein
MFSENNKNGKTKNNNSKSKSEEKEDYMFISNDDKKKIKERASRVKRYKRIHQNANRALFSKEITDRILNHENTYKLDE